MILKKHITKLHTQTRSQSRSCRKILKQAKTAITDILSKSLETLGIINRLPLQLKLLLLLFLTSGAINEIIGQIDPYRARDTISVQPFHFVTDDACNNLGASYNEAAFNAQMEVIKTALESDIRLQSMYIVPRVDREHTSDLTGSGAPGTDAINFNNWITTPANNCDNRDFQVFQTGVSGYEAYTATIGPNGNGWIITVSSGGYNEPLMAAHEAMGHGSGALDGDHNQARTGIEYTMTNDNTGQTYGPYYNGKSIGETNSGGTYLKIFTTPAQYNSAATVNGGTGTYTYNFVDEYSGDPGHIDIAVDQMHNNNGYDDVTTGLYQFFLNHPDRIHKEAVAPPATPIEDGNTADNNLSLGNISAFDAYFPNTTDVNFQSLYNTPEQYKLYLYNADNAIDGAQIDSADIDGTVANLPNGDYKIAIYSLISNGLSFSDDIVINLDITPPTGTITAGVETITNLPNFDVTFNFSEDIDPATFTQSDISLTNCDLSNLIINGNEATVTVIPDNDGNVSLWVPANKFKDLAGNWNTAIDPWSIIYDATGGAVELSTPEYPTTNENPVPFTITITEANGVNGLSQDDINAIGGTVTNWNYSGGNSATFDLTTDGTNGNYSISIPEGAFTDDAGNQSQGSNTNGALDYEAPYSIDGFQCEVDDLTNLSSFTMSVQFNESLYNLTSNKLNLNNCTISNFQDNGNGNYSWNVLSGEDGPIGVGLDAGVCHDFEGGNGNVAIPEWTTVYDGTSPSGAMTSTSNDPTNETNIPVDGNVNESPYGFDASDFETDNCSLENTFFDGQDFSFDIIPDGDGLITVTVTAGSFTDEAGNPNEEFWFTITSDQTCSPLEITFDENSPTNADLIHVNFDANEAINLTASAITVDGGILQNFEGSGDSYSGEIIPAGDGEVATSVAEGVYTDIVGNTNTQSAAGIIESDRTAPELTIDGPPAVLFGYDVEMAYASTETIVDFDNSDIDVDNGISTNFSGYGDFYVSSIIDTYPGQTIVNITGEYYDEAGNLGLAVAEFTIDIITETHEIPTNQGVNVYPNPADEKIYIDLDFNERDDITIRLNNSMGQCVLTKSLADNDKTTTLNVSNLPTGLYFLSINKGDQQISMKVQVK